MADSVLHVVEPPKSRPIRILLVDDYLDALEMWALYLRFCGYEVLTASDGLSAVEVATAARPDLVILDLDLPGISGFEAARRLRRNPRTARIPLLAATGFSHMARQEEASSLGFEDVLVKPCPPTVLLEAVEHALATTSH